MVLTDIFWELIIKKVAYNFKNTEGILTFFLVLVIYKAKNAYCIKILIQTKNQWLRFQGT